MEVNTGGTLQPENQEDIGYSGFRVDEGRAAYSFDGAIPWEMSVRQALFSPQSAADREALGKALVGDVGASIRTVPYVGVCFHPLNMHFASLVRDLSPHHSACVQTIVALVTALGLEDEEAYETLDALTEYGFDSVLQAIAMDLVDTGNGYMEVVRDPLTRRVTGLHHIEAKSIYKVQDGPRSTDYHYVYSPSWMRCAPSGTSFEFQHSGYADAAVYARFGDVDRLARLDGTTRNVDPSYLSIRDQLGIKTAIPFVDIGELIPFQLPTNRWHHYGAPGWISANPYIDLSCKHLQRTSDYMANRGTPDHLLTMLGVNLTPDQKATLQSCLAAGKGRNFGRSAAMSFPSTNAQQSKVELHKFSDGVDGAGFRELHDATALAVCSAHRVPPILAGVSVPRPLGSANEMAQALVVTEKLVALPIRRSIHRAFACSLGKRGAGLPGMTADSFKLKALTEDTDVLALDTLARQKDTTMTGGEGGRDMKQGLKR